ncbi:MAG TPA: CoA-transferase [Candidatus Acidoferrales bacterium]|nr:CoA-transferase [Candidatus Acidoferrales bacterium]
MDARVHTGAAAASPGYRLGELMVAAAAREIRDGEWVFVGMRLPLLAFLVAKRLHAPRAVGLYENGLIREEPAPEMLYTMADPPNQRGATFCGQMIDVMSLLQQGRVGVGFLGAAEVDRFGNLNSTWGNRDGRPVRLPGSGGAGDIACLARRTVVMIAHERHRLVERVGYVTSPGYGAGGDWRRQSGLPASSGPGAVLTTLGVLRFDAGGEAFLAAVHPGVRPEDVAVRTGWKLRVAGDLSETPAPSAAEIAAIREFDPEGFWTGQ